MEIGFINYRDLAVAVQVALRLTDLMIEHNVGVRIAQTVEFKRIDEDFFTKMNDSPARQSPAYLRVRHLVVGILRMQ